MKTRDQLEKEIKTAKIAKFGAIIMFLVSIMSYLIFNDQQVKAEKELLQLDHSVLDGAIF